MKIDIVTVFFDLEWEMAKLQFLSLVKNLVNIEDVNIVYVANYDLDDHAVRAMRQELAAILDSIEPIKEPEFDIIPVKLLGGVTQDGWLGQQAAKLAVAFHLKNKYYLTLDAKYLLVKRIHTSAMFSAGGLPLKKIGNVQSNQRKWHAESIQYFGGAPSADNKPIPASAPPFVLNNSVVKEIVEHIEKKETANIFSWFQNKANKCTEFTLYSAYSEIYFNSKLIESEGDHLGYISVRGSEKQVEKRCKKANQMLSDGTLVWFSVHRTRYLSLTAREKSLCFDVWFKSGLANSDSEAENILCRLLSSCSKLREYEDERLKLKQRRSASY